MKFIKTFTYTDPNTLETTTKTKPIIPIPIFSITDINSFNNLILSKIDPNRSELENALAVKEVFLVLVTEKGNYMLKYEGPIDSFSTIRIPDPNSNSLEERERFVNLEEKYIKYVAQNPEISFLNFVSTVMNGINYALYKFDLNGNITKL